MASKALLVGIDIYPYPPNNLNSCVNDTLAFRAMLMSEYGFAEGDITLLHNQAANYDNVTKAIEGLVDGAGAGDQLVYFESSHGYQRPVNGVMTECLCLYDKFLDDTDLIERTKDVPAGVLTVVLDACHAGGMEKMFFPEGQPAVARAKVFQPDQATLEERAGLLQSVTGYRFFGLSPTREIGKIANVLSDQLVKEFTFSMEKAPLDPVLNATLFAACTADQTAAAGSLATNNLSAFTYALTTQLDTGVSLNDLCSMVNERLRELNMNQSPQYYVPLSDQGLAAKTFIAEQNPTHGPSQKGYTPSDTSLRDVISKSVVELKERI